MLVDNNEDFNSERGPVTAPVSFKICSVDTPDPDFPPGSMFFMYYLSRPNASVLITNSFIVGSAEYFGYMLSAGALMARLLANPFISAAFADGRKWAYFRGNLLTGSWELDPTVKESEEEED